MAHLEPLYANGWLSDEVFNKLEWVFAQKYQISENSIFKYIHKDKVFLPSGVKQGNSPCRLYSTKYTTFCRVYSTIFIIVYRILKATLKNRRYEYRLFCCF